MTLEDIKAQCPPPEGCRWSQSDDNVWTVRGWEGDRHLAVIIKDLSSDDRDRWSVAAENFEAEARIRLITTLADLPSAYRRALQAVGLASPWTSEVPTQPGDYLVRWAETKGRPIVWTLDAGVWYGPSGVVSRPPPHGSSFLNIADLKERP